MRRRNIKILATLGPASDTEDQIRALYEAGADVFRLNMSHLDHEGLARLHAAIRRVERKSAHPIGILVDLQGPKLRVGKFEGGGADLEIGAHFAFDMTKEPGNAERVSLPHKEVFDAARPGDLLLLDDGRIRVRITANDGERMETRVEVPGRLTDRKGVNLPDTVLPLAPLTPKDRSDLDYALSLGVDWIALSFVQRADDIAETRKHVGGRAGVMAKIEKPSALNELGDIIDMADGIMVARGDLGVELPIEQVPGRQKQITRAARRAGKPVVVATQMLESMIGSPMPTRAEVSDVATAVFEGADAIMLSAESAAGKFPAEAVAMMNRVAESVEDDPNYQGIIYAQRTEPEPTTPDAITAAARQIAETLQVASIVCYTNSGSTALRAARERPQVPIVVLTPVAQTARRLALVWGLHCVLTEDATDLDDMVDRACRMAFKEGYAARGQRIVIMAGVPLGTPGATNMLRIAFVGSGALD